VNALRILSIDQVEQAHSGHPGLPLGAAPAAYSLWAYQLKHNPKNPHWINRDRFVLSAGHGSALLYSLLHLFGYEGMDLDALRHFRQLHAPTPGHPEYGHTLGVDATTGPLGAGIANGVGMAMAQAHLAKIFNKNHYPILDHYTYVLHGDGCLMEGVSAEALSLAGSLHLDKLILLYDSNRITIEGDTKLAFLEDVGKRMESYGFQVIRVDDGNNVEAISNAISQAKQEKNKPSFIEIRTIIGYGCTAKQGSASAHGEPLGAANVEQVKDYFEWESKEAFYVPKSVRNHYAMLAKNNEHFEKDWNLMMEGYFKEYPEMLEPWLTYFKENKALDALLSSESYWNQRFGKGATRSIGGTILKQLSEVVPNFFGGSADLAPSTKTYLANQGDFSAEDRLGKNVHFGVREHAMVGIANGILLHGGLRPYVSTFFVFADFMKPMMRLASLMNLPQLYILTHDSIGVGEDGPTHQPIEQLAMLRAQPNLTVYRPCDGNECLAAYAYAMQSKTTPTALILTRQDLEPQNSDPRKALQGGYVLSESKTEHPLLLLASGSEVALACKVQEALWKEGMDARVISMPSMEVFDAQSLAYKEQVLPNHLRKRIAIEAAAPLSWGRYVGLDGLIIGMDSFGASAPAKDLFAHFGFTVEHIVEQAKRLYPN
ncbi:MAG: transketolase, partial [Erysipelotrichaceae bacterium]